MPHKFDRSLIPPFPDLSFEQQLWGNGFSRVAGVDEAGRGALAGPVMAAAVILPVDNNLISQLAGVRDSKVMTPQERAARAPMIKQIALAYGIGEASHQEIDALGIVPATRLAMQRALSGLGYSPQHLLLDYIELDGIDLPQIALVKGDARSLSIAAASVLAKTARDELLCQFDSLYPGYGFAGHKGYGTAAHRRALESLGPCSIHRRSFQLLALEPIALPEKDRDGDAED